MSEQSKDNPYRLDGVVEQTLKWVNVHLNRVARIIVAMPQEALREPPFLNIYADGELAMTWAIPGKEGTLHIGVYIAPDGKVVCNRAGGGRTSQTIVSKMETYRLPEEVLTVLREKGGENNNA